MCFHRPARPGVLTCPRRMILSARSVPPGARATAAGPAGTSSRRGVRVERRAESQALDQAPVLPFEIDHSGKASALPCRITGIDSEIKGLTRFRSTVRNGVSPGRRDSPPGRLKGLVQSSRTSFTFARWSGGWSTGAPPDSWGRMQPAAVKDVARQPGSGGHQFVIEIQLMNQSRISGYQSWVRTESLRRCGSA